MRLFGISTSVLVMAAFTNSATAQDLSPHENAPVQDFENILPPLNNFLDQFPNPTQPPEYTFPNTPIEPYVPKLPECMDQPVNPVISMDFGVYLSMQNRVPCETEASLSTPTAERKFVI